MKKLLSVTAAVSCCLSLFGAIQARAEEPERWQLRVSVMHNERFLVDGNVKAYKVVDITYQDDAPVYSFTCGDIGDLPLTAEELSDLADGRNDQSGYTDIILKEVMKEDGKYTGQTIPYSEKTDVDGFGVYLVTQGDRIPEGFQPITPFLMRLTRADKSKLGTHVIYEKTVCPKQFAAERKSDDGKDPDPPEPTKRTYTGHDGSDRPDELPSEEGRVLSAIRNGIDDMVIQGPGSTIGASHLPQTGQLWWPVPVLSAAGILLIVYGMAVQRKQG